MCQICQGIIILQYLHFGCIHKLSTHVWKGSLHNAIPSFKKKTKP
jgi:hypothetical protein